MQKLLMLGSSYSAKEMIAHAKNLGVYTIVTDYLPPEHSPAKLIADEYWMISTGALDELEQKCREEGVTAVTCGISEFNQDMALELCERLGLPNYATKDAWHFNRNKADFKAVCKKLGAPVATDYYLSDALTEEELASVRFPVVVKPVDGAGNLGVSFCYNKEELVKAYRYAQSVSSNKTIIVERLIRGEEFVCLYAFADGEAALMAVDMGYVQPGEPTNCYILCTSVYSNFRQYLANIDECAKKVLKGVGCREGAAWIQFIHDQDDGVDYMIEMGYRLPGDVIFMPYQKLTGFDAPKWMVECALGIKHTPADLPEKITEPYRACAATYLLWNNKPGVFCEIDGVEEACKIPGVGVLADNCYLGAYRDVYQRTVNFLISAENCDDLCEKVRQINQLIEIKNENGEDMLIRFTDFDTVKEAYRRSLEN